MYEAMLELRIAESYFNNAEPDYFEVANAQLTAARARVAAEIRKRKDGAENG